MKRIITIAALLTLAGAMQSNATQIVRELWDNVPNTANGYLQGATNGNTSLGFFAGSKWNVNPADLAATNALLVSANSDAFDDYIKVYPMLLASATQSGSVCLAQPNTNGWDSGTWATRLLAIPSDIHLNANGVYYFSARLVKRSFYFPVSGTNGYGTDDAALGFGFSSGSSASSFFVGAGITRSVNGNPSGGGGYVAADGSTQIGDSVYTTSGTLGQAGLPGHPVDSGGPYLVRAYGSIPQEVEGYLGGSDYVAGAWLVGRLTTTTSGASELDVRAYVAGDTIDTDPSLVSWDVMYTFNSTVNLNNLLVWMYGNNNFNPTFVDGIRVATTWAEAVGEEVIGPPIASPTNSVFPGTPVTFTAIADVADGNSWYQWLTNGVPDPSAVGLGNNTYTIPNTVTNNSGMTISVAFSNGFASGLVLTSTVQTLTIFPPVPPIITQLPASGKRYAGAASFSFNVVADGARPFSYQWSQIVGGVTNALAGQTNASLTFSNIQPGSAGTFFVTVTNGYGPTKTPPVTLTVVTPTGYAAAVITNGAFAYWRLDETTNSPVITNGTVNGIVTNGNYVVIHDDWGGNDGVDLDLTNVVLGVPGIASFGFPANHTGIYMPNNSFFSRLDMPALPAYTNVMTLACWIYSPTVPNAAGLVFNRDYNQSGGYGNAYGLEFVAHSTPTSTNYNTLGYQWGGFDQNPSAAFMGYTWTNSGLYVPQFTWTFVALVLSNTQATIYMGTNNAPLTVASASMPASLDPAFPGTIYTNNFPLLFGRSGYPWAETQGNAWNGVNIQMSDVAVFYSALSPTNIYKLYLAAVGELITTTNSTGNFVLSWPAGTLTSSTNVSGPYAAVIGATSPYTVLKDKPQKFYRVEE